MSRWSAILDKLPPPLRDARVLDSVAAIDAQMQHAGENNHFSIQCYYQNGKLQTTKVVPPVVVFETEKRTS